MIRYGYPPALDECVSRPAPVSLQTSLNQQYLGFKPKMVPALTRPLPVVAVARQLLRSYDPAKVGSTSVQVENFGTFLLGPNGWALDIDQEV